ncbi:hypothetical protein Tco_1437946 [Tanacetum coccineum]
MLAVTISTVEPRTPPTTTTVFDDEDVTMAMAQTLIKMKEQKAKEKGVAITDLMDIEAIKDSEKKNDSSSKPIGGSRKKTLARKRAGEKKSEESAKKQKLKDVAEEQESAKSDEEAAADYEHEKEELRMWLTVVSDEEETMDPKILSAKYPVELVYDSFVFESTESELYELEKQNDFLKDQLLEVSLKHEVELGVLLNHECVDNSLHAEIEQLKKKSIEIQEGLQTRIKILEKDVQRIKNTNPLDYSWISKMEKLENKNVSLDFTMQSLIKKRDNVKLEYQKLFNSIKKTRSQTQTEMDELIAHVSEKTYSYGAIRAENQNLLFTISELKIDWQMLKKMIFLDINGFVILFHSKDETPEIIKKFIAQAQLNYKAKVCKIRTDNDYGNPLHVKFDELTTMASKHDSLEPVLQRFINHNSSAETIKTPSKEDLDNLFGPMFEEYFEKKFSDTPINSAAQPTQIHEDSPSTSSIIIDEHEAPPIVTTSDEQTSPISLTKADEFNQEDSADFDGNSQFVPYNPLSHEEIESSTMALEPSNVIEFHHNFKFGNLFHDQKERILLLLNGSGRISVMLKILWFETKLFLEAKGIQDRKKAIDFEESFVCWRLEVEQRALYGLKQAPRAWDDKLSSFLIEHGFTKGGLQFLGGKLLSWSSKKQDCTAMAITEDELNYVPFCMLCIVICMRTQLLDNGYKYNRILMYCDSKSAIAISCNPV